MGFIIGLLTLVMVLDCAVLILLVLIQLPKKEAGAGLAFGGAATDALFGAGSGNVLTKITKYAAIIFFVLAIFLSVLQSKYYHRSSAFLLRLSQPASSAPGPMLPSSAPSTAPATTPGAPPPGPAVALTSTNLLHSTPAIEATNLPAPPPTTAPSTNALPQK